MTMILTRHTPWFDTNTYDYRRQEAAHQLSLRLASVEPEFETYPDGSARLVRGWSPDGKRAEGLVFHPLELDTIIDANIDAITDRVFARYGLKRL